MAKIGNYLNLRGHAVGTPEITATKISTKSMKKIGKDGVIVYGPGDLEVHKGIDNKYYVVDMARLWVPEGDFNEISSKIHQV